MTSRYLYFLILLTLMALMQNTHAQEGQLVITAQKQYAYANKLFNDKDYDTAIVEFKRFIHFFPDSRQVDKANFNLAVCLFKLKKYHDAARAFNDIIINDRQNDLPEDAFFYQSKSFLKMGNTGYAQIVLQNLLKLTEKLETKDRIYFNLVQLHLEEARKSKPGSLALAKAYVSKISAAGADTYNTDHYADLIFKAEHVPQKNPTVAGLSAIIPGGGFLYCERYHDALVTFLLNAGLMVAAYEAYDNDNIALAGIIGFVETGFYTGNIYGSISSAHKYNTAQKLNILNKEFSISSAFDPGKKEYAVSFNFGF